MTHALTLIIGALLATIPFAVALDAPWHAVIALAALVFVVWHLAEIGGV